MNRYVIIKHKDNKLSSFLLYVDHTYEWSDEQRESERKKAVSIAKMAFLDHGTPLIPMDALPAVENIIPAYLTPPKEGVVLLISEGGTFMTLTPDMQIVADIQAKYYPIEPGAAIICENDSFDKHHGGIDYMFENMYKQHSKATSMHYMFSFCNRPENEIKEAFRNAPAILFYSSCTETGWWATLLVCYINSGSKAPIIGKRSGGDTGLRYDKFVAFAKKHGVDVITT